MGATAALAMVAGAGVYQSHTQYEAGKENRRIEQFNAKVGELQAKDAIDRGDQDALKQRLMARRMIGRQRAQMANSGIDLNTGSAADLTQETDALGALDALTIRNNAAREAWGYKVQAKGARMRGDIAYKQGSRAAAGTLLTTGADTYRMGYSYSQARNGGY